VVRLCGFGEEVMVGDRDGTGSGGGGGSGGKGMMMALRGMERRRGSLCWEVILGSEGHVEKKATPKDRFDPELN
jgi:hypothetical protein